MLSVDAAAATVAERIERLPVEQVSLHDARGRFLASDIVAARPLPPFDNSAMDGYAARSADLPATLPIAAHVAAGQHLSGTVPDRVVVRILTGAPLPPGLDTVVMQEDVDVTADRQGVTLPASPPGANIRRAGEDVSIGDIAVRAGAHLGPAELGLLAALGITHLSSIRAPRVALIATGDELVSVGDPLGPSQIVDSSAHSLAAMIAGVGGIVTYLGIAKDDPATMTAMLSRALEHDVVITTGGVSVGDHDHVRTAFASAGIGLDLWKVAMKPGKPFSFGTNGRVPVFGLPGNPVSTFVAFELFVRPALLAMQGATVTRRPRVPVSLAGGYRKQAGRTHFIRAAIERSGERLIAHAHPKQGSAMLSSLIGCTALVELPAEATEILPNAIVRAILLDAV